MKNRKLIKRLKEERRKLYPHGLPVLPRGCGKTYLYLGHFLKYMSFDIAIDVYKNMDREVSLEEAYEDINYFINEVWALIEDF